MKLLYISYWGINDVLTKATVIPNLNILRPHFTKIYFATIERTRVCDPTTPDNVAFIPFYSITWLPRVLQKVADFVFFGIKLFWLVKAKGVDVVICRGAMAAAFGVFLQKVLGKPFIVESFEPHADYMAEGGTWAKRGIEYRFQKWVEAQTLDTARYLLPVTENYGNALKDQGVSAERIHVMPCCVDIEKFRFKEENRKKIRTELAIPDDVVVGIYVGKFGDIYLKEESFLVFRKAAEVFRNRFFLIILTPQPIEEIKEQLISVNFDLESVHIKYVDHTRVPDYLSAADFAFSLIRTSPSRKYCSPIKDGEYWANGLPILLTSGVGDDERILDENNAGAILNLAENNTESALQKIDQIMNESRISLAKRISPVAVHHRHFNIIIEGYAKIFSLWKTGNA